MTDEPNIINLKSVDQVSGRLITKGLFKQFNPEATECLEDWRRKFVDSMDLTEYAGAIACIGSWENWKAFKRNWPRFQREHLNNWLEEIEVRMKSQALKTLIMSGDTASAKFIAEGKYKEKRAGRPTNEEKQRQLGIEVQVEKEIEADLARLTDHLHR